MTQNGVVAEQENSDLNRDGQANGRESTISELSSLSIEERDISPIKKD